jgi:hypothetical protein
VTLELGELVLEGVDSAVEQLVSALVKRREPRRRLGEG